MALREKDGLMNALTGIVLFAVFAAVAVVLFVVAVKLVIKLGYLYGKKYGYRGSVRLQLHAGIIAGCTVGTLVYLLGEYHYGGIETVVQWFGWSSATALGIGLTLMIVAELTNESTTWGAEDAQSARSHQA